MGVSGKYVTNPISFGDVQTALQVSYTDLATLCTAPAVKVNSQYKPVNTTTKFGSGDKGGLSDDERRACDWGWGNLNGGASDNSLQKALLAKLQGGTWTWVKPTSIYRLQDFNKYDGNATTPFALSITTLDSNGAQSTGAAMRLVMEGFYSELQPHINKWAYFSGANRNNMGLGVYITNSTTSVPSGNSVYFLAAAKAQWTFSTLGSSDETKDFNVASSYLSKFTAGTYYLVPFIVADTSSVNLTNNTAAISSVVSKAMVFPQAAIQFTLKTAVAPVDTVSASIVGKTTSVNGVKVTFSSLQIYVRNGGSSTQSVNVSVQIVANSEYNVQSSTGSFSSKTVSLSGGASTTIEMVSSAVSFNRYNENGSVLVDIVLNVGGTAKTIKKVNIYNAKEDE